MSYTKSKLSSVGGITHEVFGSDHPCRDCWLHKPDAAAYVQPHTHAKSFATGTDPNRSTQIYTSSYRYANTRGRYGLLVATKPGRGILHQPSIKIRGNPGLLGHHNAGWILYWHESGNSFYLGGGGTDRDTIIRIADDAARLDLSSWIKRLAQLP